MTEVAHVAAAVNPTLAYQPSGLTGPAPRRLGLYPRGRFGPCFFSPVFAGLLLRFSGGAHACASSFHMKFAKRLAQEATRKGLWTDAYFDYRGAKKAIKDDLASKDVSGSHFQGLLEAELRKVSQFYSEKADRIEANLRALYGSNDSTSVQQLTQLRAEIKELIKFVALNYLAVLDKEPDVRSVLQRRFDMTTWFRRNSFPIDTITEQAALAARREQAQQLGAAPSPSGSPAPSTGSPAPAPAPPASGPRYTFRGARQPLPTKRFALLADFDKTLVDFHSAEQLVELLAPELLPMLVGLDAAQSAIPITNSILSEMQRRGVTRDALLGALQRAGAEALPLASAELLRMMHGARIDVKLLSDCNTVFIGHMLAGAKVAGYVGEVIANPAAFERVSDAGGGVAGGGALQRSGGHRLVVTPHFNGTDSSVVLPHPPAAGAAAGGGCGCGAGRAAACCGHGCGRCPSNLCKGLEVQRLLHANTYAHLLYCGEGPGDVCAALALRASDAVLARAGGALAAYIEEACARPAMPQVVAQVALWGSQEELLACVRQIVDV
ncbi:Inorganic pyrophosphatase 2 [Tetrabaena socialis]|uniref:Inorganic pyrophosphatase 2 n=1 Tax=Tetrabaena socialis TaxID=47790 RepID=A0A2J8A9R4_9CHLO|nr:Inorganic pyrophosphatase 2 [Tetrabaena socialis]|eukprot:PNH09223.1 Inorganic pyrophosphatase 2 [Tetrabaena socialis]